MKARTSYVVAAVVIAIVVSAAYLQSGSRPANVPQSPIVLKGVGFSPRSFQEADIDDFFAWAKQAGKAVRWAGDWMELSNLQNGGPVVVASLASTYGYIPVIEVQFFRQSDGSLLRPLDEPTRKMYVASAATFAERFKPPYLGFGIEVNVLYEKSPTVFDDFVSLYDQAYDVVKAKSPSTRVYTVFQLEKMKGLNGGLFGGQNDPSKAEWSLLERFPKSDLIAFTTYPSLVFREPSAISSDHYSQISVHMSKPVAFTEIGWHSGSHPSAWASSEASQAEFVRTFFGLTKGMNVQLAIWSFLYDLNLQAPFDSMGLIRAAGTAKPAWNEWVAG